MPTQTAEIGKPSTIAIVIWVSVQLAALGLSAERIALWTGAPSSMEQYALVFIVAVQAGVSALIFPHLLCSRSSTILAVAFAWPMAQLASYLSDTSGIVLLRSEIYISIWLLSLHLYSHALRRPRAKLLGTALAGMLSFGGPVLWYLQAEFFDEALPHGITSFSAFGPMCGAISQTFARFNSGSWFELSFLFACGLMAFMGSARFYSFSRQVIH